MTTKELMTISISFLFAIASCNNRSQQKTNQTDTISKGKVIKTDPLIRDQYTLPNDKFRKEIIPKITNQIDLNMFDTLLTALDKKGISFCQYVQRLVKLDDSCYKVAKQKFPDASQQDDFMKVHDKAIQEAETKYLKDLKLRKNYSGFASVAYSLDSDIKNFCGDY